MTPRSQPLDLGILLGLAYQEFVRELREDQAGLGFGDLGRSDGFVFRALGGQPMTVSELAARRFHQRYERRLAREHGREAVANLRRLLEGIAGPEQAVDPRLRHVPVRFSRSTL